MQYLGYLLIIVAFYAGYTPWHPASVIVFALVSTLLFMSARRAAVKEEPHRQNTNMLLDGAYLFAVQGLIMFTAYIFGWLLANMFTYGTAV